VSSLKERGRVKGSLTGVFGGFGWVRACVTGVSCFPDPRLVAAIVDRVTFNAHILETGTQSYRLRTSKTTSRSRKPS
jgi:hypothetical protein